MKTVSKKAAILVFIGIFFLFFAVPEFVHALNMDSTRYHIQFAETNIGSKDQQSSNYHLNQTLGELAAQQFNSSGYIVKAGFEYIHSIIPFRFSVSNIGINLGSLTAGVPATASTVLTVSFGGAGQYQVTAEEVGKLRTFDDLNTIPDTQCNGGANTCTTSVSKVWTSSSAYGFGYNMSGQDYPADFTDGTYYRPFPDRNLSDPPVVVMSNANVGRGRQATVTFKANVSGTQGQGTYQTVINFIATPTF